jgi:hypothetical protein
MNDYAACNGSLWRNGLTGGRHPNFYRARDD